MADRNRIAPARVPPDPIAAANSVLIAQSFAARLDKNPFEAVRLKRGSRPASRRPNAPADECLLRQPALQQLGLRRESLGLQRRSLDCRAARSYGASAV